MAIKDILVHLDSSKELDHRIQFAADLAKKHDAHLTGLFVVPRIYVPNYVEVTISASVSDGILKNQWERAEETRIRTLEIFKKHGIELEWRAEEGDPVTTINRHGRCADVVILGQSNPDSSTELESDAIDKTILSLGRPVIVVPYAKTTHTVGQKIIVAWEPGRQSARAIHDALPLLIRADSVEVTSVNPEKNRFDDGQLPGVDISTHLARHGVNVENKTLHNSNIATSDVLFSHAADQGVDMIVMGAYGHSRFREIVLGGVTRDVLKHMTVPVFFSH